MADTGTETTALVAKNPHKKVKLVKKSKKPARPQVEPDFHKSEPPPQTGTIFNIWYNKWSGGDKVVTNDPALGRCHVAKDSGYTRADSIQGSYFCIFFARGLCPKGKECQYLHRLPGLTDIFNPNVDCFGRDKFSDYRDDMGGVGSFMRQNRTLYVGRIHVADNIEEVVARHFQEWGQVDRIRVLNQRGVAFVTYTNMANSEFAMEAMAHQSLDHEEILNVRWATVDPNPAAAKREARAIEEQAAEAVRRALPVEYLAEIEGRDPEYYKRRRIGNNSAANDQKAVEGVPSRGMIEAAQIEEFEATEAPPPAALQLKESPVGDAFFSGSTLAALQNRKPVTTKKPPADAGPLVGYGSESDSE